MGTHGCKFITHDKLNDSRTISWINMKSAGEIEVVGVGSEGEEGRGKWMALGKGRAVFGVRYHST